MFTPRSETPPSFLVRFRTWARGRGLSLAALQYGTAEALKRDNPESAALYESQAESIPATSDDKSTVNTWFAGQEGGS